MKARDNLILPLEAEAGLVPPSTCKLIYGDCLEVMPTLEAGSVAMVFADLPYGVTRCAWDAPVNLQTYWQQALRAAKKKCAHVLMGANPFAATLIDSNRKMYRYDLVWHKTRMSGFFNANKMPLRAHELALIFYKEAPTYNPQKRKNISGRTGAFERSHVPTSVYGKGRRGRVHTLGQPLHPHSIIQGFLPHSERGLHPTQKPIALLEWLISTYTDEGDTVLDPVMGSGTTAIACARLGRNFIGIEKDKTYFDVVSKRIADERARLGLEPAEVVS